MNIPFYQVDAFTSRIFRGNPAAVCVLDYWLPEGILQAIASEINLSATAFIVKEGKVYGLRWFTPVTEINLCGHATLSAAHILFNTSSIPSKVVKFKTQSGAMEVAKNEDQSIILDFPVDTISEVSDYSILLHCFSLQPIKVFKGDHLLLFVYRQEADIIHIKPNLTAIKKLNVKGIIVTAPGEDVDFVSRYFAPALGMEEDPVTGSIHTHLCPYWSPRLGKKKMTARQLSERGGELICRLGKKRVFLTGNAITVMQGEIFL